MVLGWVVDILPLMGKKKKHYRAFSQFLSQTQKKQFKKLLKRGIIGIAYNTFGITLTKDASYPVVHKAKDVAKFDSFIDDVNERAKKGVQELLFKQFGSSAPQVLPKVISPTIIGLKEAKAAVAMQLFSKERLSIILLADQDVHADNLLKFAARIHHTSCNPKTFVKNDFIAADGGLAALEQAQNLLKKDWIVIRSAMERGVVSVREKKTAVEKDANITVLAHAVPDAKRFVGKVNSILEKQLPLEKKLIDAFHIRFLLRYPVEDSFEPVRINTNDVAFLQAYQLYADQIDVEFPSKLESKIVDWAAKQQDTFFEVNSQTITGLIRLAQARARMALQKEVSDDDLQAAIDIVSKSLQ